MFASVENHSQIQIRLNNELGESVIIATCRSIGAARQIVDLMNEHCQFSRNISIKE